MTQRFSVHGPWRTRWQLVLASEPFLFMIIDANSSVPRFFPPQPGVLSGIHEEQRGGISSLMLHNTTPYEVILEEQTRP